ncbi:hypothetical protein [Halocola ammonii]
MKKVLLAFSILLMIGSIQKVDAQRPEYDELLKLIVDEDFEKALRKCENYQMDDDTRKDPVPYIYMSMAYFHMSKKPEYSEEYPKAFKDALKYAARFRRKDRDNEYMGEFSRYMSQLREVAIVETNALLDQEKFIQAKMFYKYLVDIDEEDIGAHLMMAYTLRKSRSKRDAEESEAMAKKLMQEKGIDHLGHEQKDFLKYALIVYSEYMDSEGMRSQAEDLLTLGKEYFEDDKEYMVTYNTIVG